ncbi:MAG: hypothetical protein GKR89_13455 [Candidatus Latescibacteria bacterium]|nr:hypothetical protein [Candidatus Latescibacterota bacterium]
MHDDLLLLPLGALDRPVKLYSRLLETAVWVTPPGTPPPDRTPAYSTLECRLLLALDLTPRELLALHLTKQMLAGDLVMPDEPEPLRQLYRALLAKFRRAAALFDQRPEPSAKTEVLRLARHLSHILDQAEHIDDQF